MVFPHPYRTNNRANGLPLGFHLEKNETAHTVSPFIFYKFRTHLEESGYKVKSADVSKWCSQGVFMWNMIPTCSTTQDFVHADIGWKKLTNEVIETIYLINPKCVFAFFGIKTLVLSSLLPMDAKAMYFPMPEVQKTEFEQSKPFFAINQMLRATGQAKINWRL